MDSYPTLIAQRTRHRRIRGHRPAASRGGATFPPPHQLAAEADAPRLGTAAAAVCRAGRLTLPLAHRRRLGIAPRDSPTEKEQP
jgi:hypothetical protein